MLPFPMFSSASIQSPSHPPDFSSLCSSPPRCCRSGASAPQLFRLLGFFTNLFRMRSSNNHARRPFGMINSKSLNLKPFRMSICGKTGEGGRQLGPTQTIPLFSTSSKDPTRSNACNSIPFLRLLHGSMETRGRGVLPSMSSHSRVGQPILAVFFQLSRITGHGTRHPLFSLLQSPPPQPLPQICPPRRNKSKTCLPTSPCLRQTPRSAPVQLSPTLFPAKRLAHPSAKSIFADRPDRKQPRRCDTPACRPPRCRPARFRQAPGSAGARVRLRANQIFPRAAEAREFASPPSNESNRPKTRAPSGRSCPRRFRASTSNISRRFFPARSPRILSTLHSNYLCTREGSRPYAPSESSPSTWRGRAAHLFCCIPCMSNSTCRQIFAAVDLRRLRFFRSPSPEKGQV